MSANHSPRPFFSIGEAHAMATKNAVALKPLADRVVVKALEETETMRGGLYIPDTAKEKPQQGEIIAAGPGKFDEKGGQRIPMDEKVGDPTVTKDGVTVAKEIELADPLENMGAQMVKEVATRTSDNAGDGTTTATVLAQAIFREGLKNVTAGANPMALKRGIDKAVQAVIEQLKRISTPTTGKTEIAQVGAISANNDKEIGDLIADAMEKVGKDGVI